MQTARALLVTVRPHQWVKNLFVAAPLVFARKLTEPDAALVTLIAVIAFCALSGAVYVLNDIVDIEKDRAHERKRKRPIPAGKISIRAATVAAVILAGSGLAATLIIDWRFAAVAAGYLGLNVAYSFWLKNIPFVDVASVAGGFLLRVLGGAYAIDVPASPWLLACTGLLAAFLGFGKRTHELVKASSKAGAGKTRSVLGTYKLSHLRVVLYVFAAATSVVYILYTRSAHTLEFFGTGHMIWTAPFCLLGILRFLMLVTKSSAGDSPTEAMLRDGLFMANLVLWGGAVVAIIYFL